MKNLFVFAVIAAALVAVWLFVKKKPTADTKPVGETAKKLADLPLVKGIFQPITTPVNGNIDFTALYNSIHAASAGGTCASLPPELRATCMGNLSSVRATPTAAKLNFSGNGALEMFAGNGALEMFTGNGALEMFIGAVNGAAKKPSCFSIWQYNINHPNGPAMPLWPGLNCRNSNSIL